MESANACWMISFLFPLLLRTGDAGEAETLFGLNPFYLGLAFFIIGVILIVNEIMSPGFFIGIPGTVLLILGLVIMYIPWVLTTTYGPILFFLLVIAVTAGVFLMYRNISKPTPSNATTTMSSLVGRGGTVARTVVPDSLSGQVVVGTQTWSATSDTEIPVGTKVVIKKVDGVHLDVVPAETKKEGDE